MLQTCPHKLFWRCVPGHCDSIDELTVYNQKATEFYNCNYLLDFPYLVKLWITHDVTLYRDFTEGYSVVQLTEQKHEIYLCSKYLIIFDAGILVIVY